MSCGCEDQNECGIELNQLPLLSGCPANNEWVLFGNATGGLGEGGYARRLWGDVKACIAGTFAPFVFVVDSGNPNNPVSGTSVWQSNLLIGLGANYNNQIQIILDSGIITNYGTNQNMVYDPVAGTIDLNYNGSLTEWNPGSGGSVDLNQ